MKSHAEYSSTNLIHWNEVAPVHQNNYVNDLLQSISDPDFTTFDPIEQKLFKKLNLSEKAVAQVCCNNARELISVKKAGAGRCVGFDISDEFIKQGEALKQAAGVDIELVCTDIYELGDHYDNQFDLIYITVGVLGQLQDLKTFFAILASLLKRVVKFLCMKCILSWNYLMKILGALLKMITSTRSLVLKRNSVTILKPKLS